MILQNYVFRYLLGAFRWIPSAVRFPSRSLIDPDAALHPNKRFGKVVFKQRKPVFSKKTAFCVQLASASIQLLFNNKICCTYIYNDIFSALSLKMPFYACDRLKSDNQVYGMIPSSSDILIIFYENNSLATETCIIPHTVCPRYHYSPFKSRESPERIVNTSKQNNLNKKLIYTNRQKQKHVRVIDSFKNRTQNSTYTQALFFLVHTL